MITAKTYKALQILRKRDYWSPMSASDFASKMWGDSKAWKRSYNTGNGACSGKGMWLSAGGYLAKLYDRDLVSQDILGVTRVWRISSDGRRAITEYEQSNN